MSSSSRNFKWFTDAPIGLKSHARARLHQLVRMYSEARMQSASQGRSKRTIRIVHFVFCLFFLKGKAIHFALITSVLIWTYMLNADEEEKLMYCARMDKKVKHFFQVRYVFCCF
jgi:hypothetical protein